MADFELTLGPGGRNVDDFLTQQSENSTVRVAVKNQSDQDSVDSFAFLDPSVYPELDFEWVFSARDLPLYRSTKAEAATLENVEVRFVVDPQSAKMAESTPIPNFLWSHSDSSSKGDDLFFCNLGTTTDRSSSFSSGLFLENLHHRAFEETNETLNTWWEQVWEQSGVSAIPDDTEIYEAAILWAEVESLQGGSENQVELRKKYLPFFTRDNADYAKEEKSSIAIVLDGEIHPNRTVKIASNGVCRVELPTVASDRYDLTEYNHLYQHVGTSENGEPKFRVNLVREDTPLLNRLESDTNSRTETFGSKNRSAGWLWKSTR